jgi:hypothetical protein
MHYFAPSLKRKLSICVYVILLLGGPILLRAQQFPMLHYTIKDGLASNTIYDIYKDPKGYFWLGTDKGISRFNGLTFENFTTADGLSDNECFFFRPDQFGRLWIGTFNGHLCFYQNGIFHNEKNTPWLKLPFTASHTTEIAINKDSSVTIFYRDDSRIVEIKDRKVRILKSEFTSKKFRDVEYSRFLYAKKIADAKYLLLYKSEAIILNFRNGHIEKVVPISPDIKNATFKQGRLFFIRHNNTLSFIDDGYTVRDLMTCDLPKSTTVYQVLCAHSDTILITNTGIYGKRHQNFSDIPAAFSSSMDGELLFVGTATDGLFVLDLSHPARKKLSPVPEAPIDYMRFVENKLLVLNKRKSLSIYETQENKKISETDVRAFHQLTPTLNFIRNDFLYSICESSSYRISLKGKNQSPQTIADPKLYSTINGFADRDTDLVFRIRRKVCRIDVNDLERKRLITVKAHFGVGVDYESFFGFAIDTQKNIWVSTVKHLYKVINDSNVLQTQFGNLAFREMIFQNNLLIGITHNNRLVICRDYKSKSVVADTINESDCVWNKFFKVDEKTLFITTNNYPRLLTFSSNSTGKPYQIRTLDNPFIPYQPEYVSASDSGLLLFAQGEMFLFPAKYLATRKPLPGIHFTYLISGNRKIHLNDTVKLSFNEAQDLKIKFQPVSFFNTALQYEYLINSGSNKGKWISFQGEELNLIKLFFGTHLIKVRAKTQSGEYSTPAVMLLNVAKPWWAEWWFLILCFGCLVLFISLAARWNIKRRLRKKEYEVRYLISEYRSLNALMNPHFVFNSLNSLQSMVNNHETEPASRYIRVFSNLLRQNMHNMTHDLIPLSKEIDLIENYLKLEKLRFKDKLNYQIIIDEDADLADIKIPPLLIQPLVENAIKHGIWPMDSAKAQLYIFVSEEGEEICVRIRHNGAPLGTTPKSDTNHESYAVENIRQRIEHLNRIHKLELSYQIYNLEMEGQYSGVECALRIPGFPNDSTESRNSSL